MGIDRNHGPLSAALDIARQIACNTDMSSTKKASSKDLPLSGSDQQSIPPGVVEMLAVQVQRMVEESGNPDGFDVRPWLLNWLHSPTQALGGRCPADYLHTPEGVDLIARFLASAQTGAYW